LFERIFHDILRDMRKHAKSAKRNKKKSHREVSVEV